MTSLSIYLSAADAMAPMAREVKAELTEAGHQVVSTWHDARPGWDQLSPMELVPVLADAVAAVQRANLLVAWTQGRDRRRSLVELGVALGSGVQVYVIGPPDRHSFDLLPGIHRWQSWVHLRRGSLLVPMVQR